MEESGRQLILTLSAVNCGLTVKPCLDGVTGYVFIANTVKTSDGELFFSPMDRPDRVRLSALVV